jgi:hypothetical protein
VQCQPTQQCRLPSSGWPLSKECLYAHEHHRSLLLLLLRRLRLLLLLCVRLLES